MKKYKKYKNSKIDWIGEIPEHWETIRFKNLFKEINKRSDTGLEDLLSVSQYTGVTKRADRTQEGDLLTNAATLEGYKLVKEKDLVSNIMLAWNGSLGFSPYDGIVSPAYSIYRLKKDDDFKYFHYLLRTETYKAEFKRKSTGVIESRLRLYTDSFFNIQSILPPKEEQTAIATFLDEKTSKIDEAVQIKECEIELLKERRQIIIQEVVTGKKVYNEKQDAWVKPEKTKDSGVEWIGEIPEDWEVRKLKYCLKSKLKYGANESGVDYDENLPRYIRITDFAFRGKLSEDNKLSLTWEQGGNYLLKDGDILFARSGATVGKSYQFRKDMSKEKFYAFAGYLIKAEPNENMIFSDFLYSYTNSPLFDRWKESIFNKATIENIGANKYEHLPVLMPNLNSQKKIISYLSIIESKISHSITLKQQEIEKLKEYKTVLIDAAVMGKIRVLEVKKMEVLQNNL